MVRYGNINLFINNQYIQKITTDKTVSIYQKKIQLTKLFQYIQKNSI